MEEITFTDKLQRKLVALNQVFKEIEKDHPEGPALLVGKSGVLLFQLYYLSYKGGNDDEIANQLVDFISEELQKPINSVTFCSGVSGFAWFLHHLKVKNFLELDEDLFIDFDEVVMASTKGMLEVGNHDFLHGGLGSMIYMIERAKENENCKKNAIELLHLLDKISEKSDKGSCWVEPEMMLDEESKGNKVVNLHLSHGQASKIVVLAKMVKAGITEAAPLCRSAVDYLMSLNVESGDEAMLPSSIVNGEEERFAHLGWCRGNVSMSVALMIASDALNDAALKTSAIEIGLHTIRHDTPEKARIYDAAICHGFAGLSHMYKRLYDYSAEGQFKVASDHWAEKMINAAVFEDGVAGFKVRDGLTKQWVNDLGLLTGMAGIGLAMIGNLSDEHMDWDDCFLLH